MDEEKGSVWWGKIWGNPQRGDLGFPGVGEERQSPFPFHRGRRPPLASGQLAGVTPWLLRVCVLC
jgi:hypothetical protein